MEGILTDRVYTQEQLDLAFDTIGYDYTNMTFNSSCGLFPGKEVATMSSLQT